MTQNNSSKSNTGGFTIIELMIATTVFSVILLIATMALIQIGRVYYKGVLSAKTQNTTRAITDEIGSSIKFSGGNVNIQKNLNSGVLCIGNSRYTFNTDQKLEDSGNFVLIADKPSPCNTSAGFIIGDACSPPGCRELLTPGMRLSKFEVVQDPTSSNMYRIIIGVISGETDLLTVDHLGCGASLQTGGQFCAASELTTFVQKRI